MKKILFGLIILTLMSSCSEKIYLYKAKITSMDVNGTDKFGPKNGSRVSVAIEDPLEPKNINDNLGMLISRSNLRANNNFINHIFLNGDFGDLDKVYINYLQQSVIPNFVADNVNIKQEDWEIFKADFESKTNYSAKKSLMFQSKYLQIRKAMERSVYEMNEVQITQKHKIETLFKSKLESNVKSVLSQNVNLSAEVKGSIENLVNTNVNIVGTYYDVQFTPFFRGELVQLFQDYKTSPPNRNLNAFTRNYYSYYVENKDFLSDGYGILVLTTNYNTSKITKAQIQALIDADANLTADQKTQLTAQVFASFSVDKNFNGEAKSTKNYMIKYQYNDQIESLRPIN